jgi:hypothetical protein
MGAMRTRGLPLACAMAGLTAALLPAEAFAGTALGAGVIAGSGSASPGLGALPAAETLSYSGTLTGVAVVGATPVTGTDFCSFSGTSGALGDSVAFGLGQVNGSCSGAVSIFAALTYVRVGPVLAVEGNGTIDNNAVEVVGACVFASTQAPTITTFVIDCAALGA